MFTVRQVEYIARYHISSIKTASRQSIKYRIGIYHIKTKFHGIYTAYNVNRHRAYIATGIASHDIYRHISYYQHAHRTHLQEEHIDIGIHRHRDASASHVYISRIYIYIASAHQHRIKYKYRASRQTDAPGQYRDTHQYQYRSTVTHKSGRDAYAQHVRTYVCIRRQVAYIGAERETHKTASRDRQ
jgi:hypothetical protein